MTEWYQHYQPDVIIATEGWIVETFLKSAGAELGKQVPAISISADFGDFSGIRQGADLIGFAAADILTAHIIRNERGIPERPKTMMVEGSWIDRGTAPPVKTRKKKIQRL